MTRSGPAASHVLDRVLVLEMVMNETHRYPGVFADASDRQIFQADITDHRQRGVDELEPHPFIGTRFVLAAGSCNDGCLHDSFHLCA